VKLSDLPAEPAIDSEPSVHELARRTGHRRDLDQWGRLRRRTVRGDQIFWKANLAGQLNINQCNIKNIKQSHAPLIGVSGKPSGMTAERLCPVF
jgi:hypothetical protein